MKGGHLDREIGNIPSTTSRGGDLASRMGGLKGGQTSGRRDLANWTILTCREAGNRKGDWRGDWIGGKEKTVAVAK